MSGARALWHSDRLDDAERVAAEGVQRFPSDLLALMEHGWVATARHDWAAAVRRWARAHEADPDRVEPVPRLVQALRLIGRIDDAESLAKERLAHHPDDTDLLIEHVWGALARQDWPTAAARFDAAYRGAQDPARIEQSFAAFASRLRAVAVTGTKEPAGRPAPIAAPAVVSPDPEEDAEISTSSLMLSFESIGERCDFGAVQRHFGVEPLGLLRFAWSRIDSLVGALDDRFNAVGTVDDTGFERFGDETILLMKKYGLVFHTFVYGVDQETSDKREAFYQQQRRRLLFLKDKLIADLEEPQKIYIYATNEYAADDDVARLHAALRAYGPNSLLYVRPERDGRPAGTVEQIEDGLYAGYFPGLVNFVGGNQPPFGLWRRLCLQTYRLVRDGSGNEFLKALL